MLKHKQIQAGDVFCFYTVLKEAERTTKHKRFLCKCVCGTEKSVLAFTLVSGESWHCGCKTKELRAKLWHEKPDEFKLAWKAKCNNTKHNKHDTKEYQAWADMKTRCANKSHKWFESYGGRGIMVCDAWQSFENFFNDMGSAPSPNHQIDRINNDGNYEPSNCRWATPSQNQRNKSNSRFIETPDGFMNISDAADIYKLSSDCIKHRIKANWSTQEIFFTPSQRTKNESV
jgi:hypothetical protein